MRECGAPRGYGCKRPAGRPALAGSLPRTLWHGTCDSSRPLKAAAAPHARRCRHPPSTSGRATALTTTLRRALHSRGPCAVVTTFMRLCKRPLSSVRCDGWVRASELRHARLCWPQSPEQNAPCSKKTARGYLGALVAARKSVAQVEAASTGMFMPCRRSAGPLSIPLVISSVFSLSYLPPQQLLEVSGRQERRFQPLLPVSGPRGGAARWTTICLTLCWISR